MDQIKILKAAPDKQRGLVDMGLLNKTEPVIFFGRHLNPKWKFHELWSLSIKDYNDATPLNLWHFFITQDRWYKVANPLRKKKRFFFKILIFQKFGIKTEEQIPLNINWNILTLKKLQKWVKRLVFTQWRGIWRWKK